MLPVTSFAAKGTVLKINGNSGKDLLTFACNETQKRSDGYAPYNMKLEIKVYVNGKLAVTDKSLVYDLYNAGVLHPSYAKRVLTGLEFTPADGYVLDRVSGIATLTNGGEVIEIVQTNAYTVAKIIYVFLLEQEKKEFTVSYDWGEVDASAKATLPSDASVTEGGKYTVDDGSKYANLTVSGTKDGVNGTYSFAGWDKTGEITVDSDVVVKALWDFSASTYTVTTEVYVDGIGGGYNKQALPEGVAEVVSYPAGTKLKDIADANKAIINKAYPKHIFLKDTSENHEFGADDVLTGNIVTKLYYNAPYYITYYDSRESYENDVKPFYEVEGDWNQVNQKRYSRGVRHTVHSFAATGFTAPSGMIFDHWEIVTDSDDPNVTNVVGEQTYMTSPVSDIDYYAVYKADPDNEYTITYQLLNGSGALIKEVTEYADTAKAKEIVTVAKKYTQPGFYVTDWSSSDVAISTDGDSDKYFEMPAKNVVITANVNDKVTNVKFYIRKGNDNIPGQNDYIPDELDSKDKSTSYDIDNYYQWGTGTMSAELIKVIFDSDNARLNYKSKLADPNYKESGSFAAADFDAKKADTGISIDFDDVRWYVVKLEGSKWNVDGALLHNVQYNWGEVDASQIPDGYALPASAKIEPIYGNPYTVDDGSLYEGLAVSGARNGVYGTYTFKGWDKTGDITVSSDTDISAQWEFASAPYTLNIAVLDFEKAKETGDIYAAAQNNALFTTITSEEFASLDAALNASVNEGDKIGDVTFDEPYYGGDISAENPRGARFAYDGKLYGANAYVSRQNMYTVDHERRTVTVYFTQLIGIEYDANKPDGVTGTVTVPDNYYNVFNSNDSYTFAGKKTAPETLNTDEKEYTFIGWAFERSAAEADITDDYVIRAKEIGDFISANSNGGEVTLYAVWTSNNTAYPLNVEIYLDGELSDESKNFPTRYVGVDKKVAEFADQQTAAVKQLYAEEDFYFAADEGSYTFGDELMSEPVTLKYYFYTYYTVSYNDGKGNVVTDAEKRVMGTEYTVKSFAETELTARENKSFIGWIPSTDEVSAEVGANTSQPKSNVEYLASWSDTYAVTTIARGGTITPSESGIDAGASFTVEYAPAGSNVLAQIKVDGEEIDIADYADSYTFENIDASHVIMVVFTANGEATPNTAGTVNVIHNFNTVGGNRVDTLGPIEIDDAELGAMFAISSIEKYLEFNGNAYTLNDAVTITRTIKKFTLSFDLNGGEAEDAPTAIREIWGADVELPVVNTVNKPFLGWSTDKDAQIALANFIMPSEDTTLYAVYSDGYTVNLELDPAVIDSEKISGNVENYDAVVTKRLLGVGERLEFPDLENYYTERAIEKGIDVAGWSLVPDIDPTDADTRLYRGGYVVRAADAQDGEITLYAIFKNDKTAGIMDAIKDAITGDKDSGKIPDKDSGRVPDKDSGKIPDKGDDKDDNRQEDKDSGPVPTGEKSTVEETVIEKVSSFGKIVLQKLADIMDDEWGDSDTIVVSNIDAFEFKPGYDYTVNLNYTRVIPPTNDEEPGGGDGDDGEGDDDEGGDGDGDDDASGGGGTSGGGSSSDGDIDDETVIFDVIDEIVPLDNGIIIIDEEVPLGNLPTTGSSRAIAAAAVSAAIAAAIALRKKDEEDK